MEFNKGEESSKLEITEDLCKFSIYSNLGSEVIAARLRTFCTSSHFNHSSSKDQFIWHSGFPPKINLINPSTIHGVLNYGKSIQDKWFLVWCLFQISSQFDCEICVSNSNGEFKLIEAAEVLPFRSRADTFSSHDQTTTINSNYTPASANSSPVISVYAQNKLASGDGPGSGTTKSFSLGLSLSHKGTRVSSLNTDQKAKHKLLQDFAQQLMGNTEDMIALQITRLEWDIFAEMKPRHLIRYILAPRDPKNPRVALRDPNSPIARSTNFLNHLAVWASSMILIQEKLKNRARLLFKMITVAYKLRDMDNFHSLMGVLAGIKAQSVYRLAATFEVVQQMDLQAYRRYLSLKKLMSSQKLFSAYRLARQTTSAQCVPYLGTYLQDITAINEFKEDMKDGKVNLTKFLQICKAATTVLQCEKLAPEIQIDKSSEYY
ncbi:ras guanine nucleotide exchange factor domain-containing protein [Phakopsora pachyrhizi]|nr:ras guanine nucleotide exchange factor domain-containing protein [Phakopsora pachyrhizi]